MTHTVTMRRNNDCGHVAAYYNNKRQLWNKRLYSPNPDMTLAQAQHCNQAADACRDRATYYTNISSR